MTNFDLWKLYTGGSASPDNYLDWGYRYLIAACLQRRVWLSASHAPCYPNIYPILVGRPGVGKGQCIRLVDDILRHHKLEAGISSAAKTDDEKQIANDIAAADIKAAQDSEGFNNSNSKNLDKPLLFAMAPSATTYEALVQAMARSIRRINYSEYDERAGKEMMKICSHSSLAFSLQELGSLFRKHANDLVNFLQEAYDCTDEYTYVTKTQGKDRIRKCCLNMLAGTTPEFMQSTFNDGLLNQGFTSRAFFIYAQKNRKSVFFVPELTKEQAAARDKIKEHVKSLSTLYGQVKIDADTANFLQEWWTEFESNPQRRVNKSRKLEAYYSRMNIHVMKVAMAIHFGESLEMTIPRETFEQAIEVLRKEEKTMHLALTMEAGNPLSDASSKILNYMRANGQKTFEELHVEFWDTVRREELTEILEFCQETHQITAITETDEYTHETKLVYKLKV